MNRPTHVYSEAALNERVGRPRGRACTKGTEFDRFMQTGAQTGTRPVSSEGRALP